MSAVRLFCVAVCLSSVVACGSSNDGNNTTNGDPDGDGGDPAAASFDGTWNEVAITMCYSFTGSVPWNVTNGAFSGPLFTYCAVAKDGTTRLAGADECGADIREDVSIDGSFSSDRADGNLTLTGACVTAPMATKPSSPRTWQPAAVSGAPSR